MEFVLAVLVGLGLSAACGFRVFVPGLVAGIAVRCGFLNVADGFDWLGSDLAIVALSVGTVCEVVSYYVPVVDNFLDTVAAPVAMIAGTVLGSAMLTDMDPWLQWSLGAIGGGGAAGVIQLGTSQLRAVSTTLTGGLGNGFVSTGESVLATAGSVLSILYPVIGGLLMILAVVVFGYFAIKMIKFFFRKKKLATAG